MYTTSRGKHGTNNISGTEKMKSLISQIPETPVHHFSYYHLIPLQSHLFTRTPLPFHSLLIFQDEAQVNVARDIAVQMCDVFDQKDYIGVLNVSYMAAVSTDLSLKLKCFTSALTQCISVSHSISFPPPPGPLSLSLNHTPALSFTSTQTLSHSLALSLSLRHLCLTLSPSKHWQKS